MAVYDKKLFDVVIEDFSDSHVDEVSRVYEDCNPSPIIKAAAVAAALRSRCLGPDRAMVGRVALRKSDRRVLGYCLSIPVPSIDQSGAVVTGRIVMNEIKRRVWKTPRMWVSLGAMIVRRLRAKVLRRGGKERLDALRSASDGSLKEVEFIAQLGVAQEARFSNLGFDLMLDMENQAQERGACRVCGLVSPKNRTAQRLYQAIGWRRTSEGSDKYDFFLMHKDLGATKP